MGFFPKNNYHTFNWILEKFYLKNKRKFSGSISPDFRKWTWTFCPSNRKRPIRKLWENVYTILFKYLSSLYHLHTNVNTWIQNLYQLSGVYGPIVILYWMHRFLYLVNATSNFKTKLVTKINSYNNLSESYVLEINSIISKTK